MADTVAVLAAVDADPEQVHLEGVRQAARLGGHISGDPDVQTSGVFTVNGETYTLDGTVALYTWPLIRSFVGSHSVSPVLLPPRIA